MLKLANAIFFSKNMLINSVKLGLKNKHLLRNASLFNISENSKKFTIQPENINKPRLDKVVKDAEEIVGYGTSMANLRWLINDEVANIAQKMKKLVGTDHPLLDIAKSLIFNEKTNTQTWGLLILLISKAAGNRINSKQLEESGILHDQRKLAELTELLKTGHYIHTGILHPNSDESDETKNELMHSGNKIALLSGDFLFAKALEILASMRNVHILNSIMSAHRDLTESEFIGERNPQNEPIPSMPISENFTLITNVKNDVDTDFLMDANRLKPLDTISSIGNPIEEWTMRNISSGGSLLGKSCECALYLGGHDKELQTFGYNFGCHTALAWQATNDINTFKFSSKNNFSLVSAPVLFALSHDRSLYETIKPGLIHIKYVNFDRIRDAVTNGPALEYTIMLLNKHSEAALKCLEHFPRSNATNALSSIIEAMNI